MTSKIITYIFDLIVAFYSFQKILGYKCTIKNKATYIFLSVALGFPAFFLYTKISILCTLFLYFSIVIACAFIFGVSFKISIKASIFSLSFSYCSLFILTLITSPMCAFILKSGNTEIKYYIIRTILGILQLTLIYLFFKIQKFKKGFSLLATSNVSSNVGIIICFIFLMTTSFFSTKNISNPYFMVFIITASIICIIIYLWSVQILKHAYLKKVFDRNTLQTNQIIDDQKKIIDSYSIDNERLSSIIHHDNKMIPVMILFITDIINNLNQQNNNQEFLKRTETFLKDLKEYEKSRNLSIVPPSYNDNITFNSGISKLDTLLKYMYLRSKTMSTTLEVTFDENFHKNNISEIYKITTDELCSIVADLLENGLYATKLSKDKKISINFSINNNIFIIKIYDTGIPFADKVLLNYGLSQTTTHPDTGGSGIGLINITTIMHKYHGSIYIQDDNIYTKSISLCFNNKCELLINHNKKSISRFI